MEITTYSILIWITSVIVGSLGLVIALGSDRRSSRTFAFNVGLIVIWSISVGILPSLNNTTTENSVLRFTFYMGSLIATAFFYFCITFPEDVRPSNKLFFSLVILEICLIPIYCTPGLIIDSTFRISSMWGWGQTYGPLWFLFDIHYFFFWICGVFILYKKYKTISLHSQKTNLKLMIMGLLVGFIPPTLFSIILPRIGYFDLNWFGPVSGNLWVCVIAYSILRYRQMNIRAALTEVLAIAMAAIFFINIFIGTPIGILGRTMTFIVFIILAYFLIRSSLREAQQKEQLKDLNLNLENKVVAQTAEIKKSYDLEKHARRELEKLNETKDQFIMITQHHLRTPVTNMRWQLEYMKSGRFGELKGELKNAVDNAIISVNRLIRIVDDFLSITAIKIGTNILNISPASLKPLVEDIIHELSFDIDSMNLKITYPTDEHSWPKLAVDASKIREVLLIVIENAVRYNIPDGSIKMKTYSDKNNFQITIENTGMGLVKEEKDKIFGKLFYRSERAHKAYHLGMGVGLTVAKMIVRGHHGDISIESDGISKGAAVTINLPIKNAQVE
jgi:signal transduction histidine kinase